MVLEIPTASFTALSEASYRAANRLFDGNGAPGGACVADCAATHAGYRIPMTTFPNWLVDS